MAENSRILGDHGRSKNRLIPPLLMAFGNKFTPYSWATQIVPELLWVALLIDKYGLGPGGELVAEIGSMGAELSQYEAKPNFSKITSFSYLSSEDKNVLRERMGGSKISMLSEALRPLHYLCPDNPLNFIENPELSGQEGQLTEDQETEYLSELLDRIYDRQSKISAFTMAIAMYSEIVQGRVIVSEDIARKLHEDMLEISSYPDTPKSRAAAASFRASAGFLVMDDGTGTESSNSRDWVEYFWACVSGLGDCLVQDDIFVDDKLPSDPLGKIVFSYRNLAKAELKHRLDEWGYDLNSIEKFEVVGALLARQTTLAIEFASSPPIWTPHCAPILLRAMADVFIAIAWIVKDPEKRSKQFIEDGLGAIKLELAHRKRRLELGDTDDEEGAERKMIDYWETWLASQRMDQLVEVNLGSWSGMSTRKMAEESGFLDFYNYVYQPFSAAVHSSWPHISSNNTVFCPKSGPQISQNSNYR